MIISIITTFIKKFELSDKTLQSFAIDLFQNAFMENLSIITHVFNIECKIYSLLQNNIVSFLNLIIFLISFKIIFSSIFDPKTLDFYLLNWTFLFASDKLTFVKLYFSCFTITQNFDGGYLLNKQSRRSIFLNYIKNNLLSFRTDFTY
jgi:hypothetical protein